MGNEPIALQRWNEGLNLGAYPGTNGGVCKGQECPGYHKGTYHLVFVLPLQDQVEQSDGPGEEDHRLVKVGERSMSPAQFVRDHRPGNDGRRMNHKSQKKRACGYASKGLGTVREVTDVEDHRCQINEYHITYQFCVQCGMHNCCLSHHLSPFVVLSFKAVTSSSKLLSKAALLRFVLPATMISLLSFSGSTRTHHLL